MTKIKRRYEFCMYCGGEIVFKYIRNEGKKVHICNSCNRILYYNSKPCAGALIVQKDKILLVKRNKAPYKGYWDIPGGFLEPGEHPEVGMIREVKEETGLEVKPLEIIGIFMDKYGPDSDDTLNIHYIAKVVGGTEKAASDAAALKWFSKSNLPKKVAFRNGREVLQAWLNRG